MVLLFVFSHNILQGEHNWKAEVGNSNTSVEF